MLPKRPRFLIWFRWHDHFEDGVQIARSFFADQTFAFNAQTLPTLATRRDG
uniref:Uncharacterized protein n=1 Tax=Yersinia enterocolitica W22703 TaxID=913028 RepID=F4N6C3_YEREN|nr:unknown protein [Yersinia enterocolitica W22703]